MTAGDQRGDKAGIQTGLLDTGSAQEPFARTLAMNLFQLASPMTNSRPIPSPVGALLRKWRAARGRSQLELALDMGVSQRHVSFIESGRSSPSRALLLGLANALNVPLRDRNVLLLAAGFAPMYAEAAWDAAEMRVVHRALERMLKQHEPYPALVMDRHWNVLMTNDAAPNFFGQFIDLETFPRPRNLLRLMFDPKGLRPFVGNWEVVAASLIQRVHGEAVGGVLDDVMRSLVDELLAFPGVSPDWRTPDAASTSPVVPISFVKEGHASTWFSMVSTVGTPQAVAAQELRVECMFKTDQAEEA
jgi:transcriptional regulator with XRE-family HTH domain